MIRGCRVCPGGHVLSAAARNLDRPNGLFRLVPHQIDRQQSVGEVRALDFNAVGEHERPLELPCRNSAVEVIPGVVIGLPTGDHKLAIFDDYLKLMSGETGNRERDAEAFVRAVATSDPFDIVRRKAIGSSFARPLEYPFHVLETEKHGMR